MNRRIGLRLASVIFAITVPSGLMAQLPDSLYGIWDLNVDESVQSSDRFRRTVCEIEPWEDGLRVSYDLVGERGGVIHLEWTGRFDGQDYTLQGVDYWMTYAYTQIDDRAYSVVAKVDGETVATAHTTVAVDGRTLTTVTRERGADVETVVVYEKRGPG